jgi:hypothetical protein
VAGLSIGHLFLLSGRARAAQDRSAPAQDVRTGPGGIERRARPQGEPGPGTPRRRASDRLATAQGPR